MTFADDVLESYFRRLRVGKETYARAQWAFLHGEGPQPDHKQLGVSDKDAQRIQIRLCGDEIVLMPLGA